jgi:nitrogen fixation-related uncharacterized protein
MHSIGMDDVGEALLITAGLSVVAVIIVSLAMWWVFKVFKNNDKDKNS